MFGAVGTKIIPVRLCKQQCCCGGNVRHSQPLRPLQGPVLLFLIHLSCSPITEHKFCHLNTHTRIYIYI